MVGAVVLVLVHTALVRAARLGTEFGPCSLDPLGVMHNRTPLQGLG